MPNDKNHLTAAILLAAGASRRMGGPGADGDKLWAGLGGEPLIARPLRTLGALHGVDALIVVAPLTRHDALRALAANLEVDVLCVEGGARRQDSVAAGLAAAPAAAWYLVHDGARPLVTAALACRVLEAARTHGAAIPALPLADTIKRIDASGRVRQTLDREWLRAVQTPQAFAGDLLRRAHAQAAAGSGMRSGAEATDDGVLVERLGAPVHVVEGEADNVKVTAARDLALVRALVAAARGEEEGEGGG